VTRRLQGGYEQAVREFVRAALSSSSRI